MSVKESEKETLVRRENNNKTRIKTTEYLHLKGETAFQNSLRPSVQHPKDNIGDFCLVQVITEISN